MERWIFTLAGLHLLCVTVEASYFKYYLDKGVNLDNRLKLPSLMRFKRLFKYAFYALLCAVITLGLGLTQYEEQHCRKDQFLQANGKECGSCPFVLGSSCLECTGPQECTTCQSQNYLLDGQCYTCDSLIKNCQDCDRDQCF